MNRLAEIEELDAAIEQLKDNRWRLSVKVLEKFYEWAATNRIACKPTDYHLKEITTDIVIFEHDCWEHQYDLHTIEQVTVPRSFFNG